MKVKKGFFIRIIGIKKKIQINFMKFVQIT